MATGASTTTFDSSGYTLTPEVWRATRDNVLVEDITAYLTGGTLDVEIQRDVKGQVTVELRDAPQIAPYQDFLAVFLTVTPDDGAAAVKRQLGLFAVPVQGSDIDLQQEVGSIEGYDLCWILQGSAVTAPYVVGSTDNVVNEVIKVIKAAGLSRYAIPAHTATLKKKVTYPPGTSRLAICNDLLEAIGYWHLWADGSGVLTSRPLSRMKGVTPFATYYPANLLNPVRFRPMSNYVANVVIVQADNTDGDPIRAVARNDNPNHPLSTVSLGYEITRNYTQAKVQTTAAATELAKKLLEEGKSWAKALEIDVLHDPMVGWHQTAKLKFTGPTTSLSGRYWVYAWHMGLDVDTPLTLELNQLYVDEEDVDVAEQDE